MKRVFTLITVLALAASFCACGNDGKDAGKDTDTKTTASAVTEAGSAETETKAVTDTTALTSANTESASVDDDAVFAIETSLTTLYYPEKWKDQVTVTVEDAQVSFTTTDGTQLFELVFAESDEGYFIGTYGETPIYMIDHMVYDDTLAAMQEDVNVIISHLMEDEQFTMSTAK